MDKLKKMLRSRGIQASIIVYFMGLITIVVLFLSLFSFRSTISEAENLSISYTERLLREVNASIDEYINNMKSMSGVVVENQDVRRLMAYFDKQRGTPPPEEDISYLNQLKERASLHMSTVSKTREDITNIAVISKYGDIILGNPIEKVNPYSTYNLSDWYLGPMASKEDIVVSPSHVQTLIEGEYRWVISISKAILDIETGELTGIMVVDLNYHTIEEICERVQFGGDGYIYLVDKKNSLIYHPQQQLVYSGIKKENTKEIFKTAKEKNIVYQTNENKIYLRNNSPVTGWSAIGVVNTEGLITNRTNIIRYYVIMGCISFIFSVIFAFSISKNITRPIKKLEQTMHLVEQGDLSIKAEVEQNNEIGHLSKTFNRMVSRINALMQSEKQKEEEKRKSEIMALQAQINPHFLYNTLETIIWMSASGKKDDVVLVTSALAKLFRTSISQGESLVPVSVEVQNIESYLTIQKMRYKSKLNYKIDIPQSFYNYRIPKLILQPIVENAIYHGIKPTIDGGTVSINAKIDENRNLVFTIKDTGVGMSEEEINQLFALKKDNSRAIGVLNVHNRIRLVFGQNFGLRYTSEKNNGTLVEILLPAVSERDANYETL